MDGQVDPIRRALVEPFPFAFGVVVEEAAYVIGIVVLFRGHGELLLRVRIASNSDRVPEDIGVTGYSMGGLDPYVRD